MRDCAVAVNKILFNSKETAYTVFQGVILKYSARTKTFTPTKEVQTFVGTFPCIFLGDRFEIKANEVFNPQYGPQYEVFYSKRAEPGSLVEVRKFLSRNIKKMTPKRVEQVIEKYGLDSIHQICEDPHALDFLGLTPTETDDLRSTLLLNASFEGTMSYLQNHNIDCRFALPLHNKYKEQAGLIMEDNPYIPYMDGIYDFSVADKLYLAQHKPADGEKRCLYTTFAALQLDMNNNGNVFVPKQNIRHIVMSFITETAKTMEEQDCPFSDMSVLNAVNTLENTGLIVTDTIAGQEVVYLHDNFYAEKNVVKSLTLLSQTPKRLNFKKSDIESFLTAYELTSGVKLAGEQKSAVVMALTSPVSIISGGPGTGKTQTINAIKAAIFAAAPKAVVRACAPTGKAAIRVTELTQIPASTIHRSLNIAPGCERIQDGELDCDFIFVDEFSMVDIDLCAKFFNAVSPCGRVVMVGDYNQLPSVGPGLVLRDLIASNRVPKTILTHVFRQSGNSKIITNASAIIQRNPGQDLRLQISNRPNDDFYFIQENDPTFIVRKVQQSLKRLSSTYHLGSSSVQVLSPVKFGLLGTEHLNQVLQGMNQSKASLEFEDKLFRLGDKVVHTQNDYDLEVFNGEVGYISDIAYKKDQALCVTYPDRDIWYPFTALSKLDLAYAMTVHKLQGSEYQVIIMPVHDCQGRGLSKNLIYTALTRAKRMVILIGDPCSFSTGIRRETTIARESNLIGRLQDALPNCVNALPC